MRALLASLALVAGCDVDPSATVPSPPPPMPLLTTPDVITAGEVMRLRVEGAPPGERVFFGASLSATGAPACPPPMAPTCLDLVEPVALLGAVTATVGGRAQLQVTVPRSLAGRPLWLQAAVRSGPDYVVSNDLHDQVTVPGVCPPDSCGPPGGVCDASPLAPGVASAAAFAADTITGVAGTPHTVLCAQTQVVAGTVFGLGLDLGGPVWFATVFVDLAGQQTVTSATPLP